MKNNDFKLKLRFAFTAVILFLGIATYAQQLSVNGVVRDAETGEPIFGVNILENGTSNGTITDFDGKFTIQASAKATLTLKYVGYQTQEVAVNGQNSLVVNLKEDAIAIGEVLVIGYGTVKKNDATGSLTAIKPDEMNKGLVTNAQDMLAGKIAGVSVTSGGGSPGASATIRIRGGSSLSASNDPLIVIDGLAMDNEGIKGVSNLLSTINPNDIESFTVLKDASATAIYGSRASNGVIIINTKKGKANQKPMISYDGTASVSQLGKYYDVLSADEFRSLVTDVFSETQPDVVAQLGTANTDWQREIYQKAFSQDHNISIMGGYKNIPYRVSLGYTNQNGIIKTSNFERVTGTVNLSPSFLDDHLKVNVNAKGMYAKNRYADTGAIGQAAAYDPTQPVMSDDELYVKSFGGYYQAYNLIPVTDAMYNPNIHVVNVWDEVKQVDVPNAVWFNTLAVRNPVASLMQKNDVANSQNFIGNAEFDYKFHWLPELRAHLNLGTDQAYGKQEITIPVQAASDHNWGRGGYEEISKFNNSLNFWMQYAKESGLHTFDVMGGYEWQHFYREGHKEYYGLVLYDADKNGTLDEGETWYNPQYPPDWATENKLVSFFGRANYSYANRYLLTATVRYDGSSRFAPENRWGLFPSFAFAWKINEEGFLADVREIDDLKLRLGYGITGQQNIGQGDYPWIPVYKDNIQGAYYPFEDADGNITYYPTSRPNAYNADLKWEETTTYNAGLDFGFFKSRLTGSVDYYFRRSENLLNVIDIPMGTNFSNRVISNIGILDNEGFEIALDAKLISQKDFSWQVGVNGAHNKNTIQKLTTGSGEGTNVFVGSISTGVGAYIQAHSVGHPSHSFYVYEQVYDETTGLPIEGEFVDRNEDGTVNASDMYYHESPTPDFTLGLTNKLIYKQFDFSFSVRSSIGNYMYNDVAARSHNMSDTGIFSSSGNGYFVNKPASALVTNFTENKPDSHFSDYYIQDASFVRVDNISLGYSFKKALDVISSGRIFATVQNPLVFTNYTGLDPEVFDGIDRELYPRPIITMIGVSLKF